MLDREIVDRITSAVDAAFERQLEFTAELIRHPSLRTDESSAQDLIADALAQRGLEIDRWPIDSEQLRSHVGFGAATVTYDNLENVVGTYIPSDVRGRSLILNGHVDVVPAGPEGEWTASPWDPRIVDGWMYGRGSGDMKAGIAANIFALDALKGAGLRPTAQIHVQSVVEEECTGNGSLSALLRGYRADAVIISEPEGNQLVRANVGVIWFKVRVSGRPTHVLQMSQGFNAIEAAFGVMSRLKDLQSEWNARKDQHAYFDGVAQPINFNIGQIVGGDWPSSVPAWCEFDVRASFYPGISAEDAWAELVRCLESAESPDGVAAVTYERTGFFSEGYVLEEGSEAEETLRGAHQQVFGAELESLTRPSYLDARVFTLYGDTPSLVYGPRAEDIHGFDERVEIESVRRITKSIALFIAAWCGVTEI